MTSRIEQRMGAGRVCRNGKMASRANAVRDRLLGAVLALLALATCMFSARTADASKAAESLVPGNAKEIPSDSRIELAGSKSRGDGASSVAPPRGSSAQLEGGSSADRYGGSSADRGGVAGSRDIRNRGVRQKGFKTGPESRGDGGNRADRNEDGERSQDDEEE